MHTFTPPTLLALDRDILQMLERDLPRSGVLSVLLEVNPASPLNTGGALNLRARNLLAPLEVPELLVLNLLDNLEDAQRSTRTRAYFLWKEHGHVKALLVDAQLKLPEDARFGVPNLEPLLYALESGSRTVIALIDADWGRLFGVHLGVIRELYRLVNAVEQGGHFREHPLDGPVRTHPEEADNARFEGHAEAQLERFQGALVEQLRHLHAVGVFERLLIAGPVRARAGLRAQLGTDLERRVGGEFAVEGDGSASITAVLEAAHEALDQAEVGGEATLLEDVRERGVRGLTETLKAAQQGRVHQLLVAGDGSSQHVWQDSTGHLYGAYPDGGRSPLDGLAVRQKRLSDVLPELRERYGLQARFLRLEQAHILETELGGLAGLLRY